MRVATRQRRDAHGTEQLDLQRPRTRAVPRAEDQIRKKCKALFAAFTTTGCAS